MTHDKIERSDVLNFFEYEKVRAAMRERVIELKRVRRVTVGEHLSFVFDNRDTVLFQIQGMCRVERITDDARIQDELDVYNALLPGPRELSATLFIEITEKEQIQPLLDRFMGIDIGPTVWMQWARSSPCPATSKRSLRRGEGQARGGPLRALRFPAGSGAGVCRLPGLPGGRPPGRAGARRALGGDEGPAPPRPSRLTYESRTGDGALSGLSSYPAGSLVYPLRFITSKSR